MSTFSVIIYIFGALVFSYLLGSVSFAVVIGNCFAHKDVRKMGSGNAGMTNVMRVIGAKAGIITFVLDCLKGFVAAIIAKSVVFEYIFENRPVAWLSPVYWGYICGIFCLIGHMYPIFFRFHGGKGVATTAGIILACNPIVFAIGISVFIIAFLISKTVSISSLLAAITIVIGTAFLYEKTGLIHTRLIQTALVLLIAAVIFLKHRDNIDRIANGEEKPLEIKKGGE